MHLPGREADFGVENRVGLRRGWLPCVPGDPVALFIWLHVDLFTFGSTASGIPWRIIEYFSMCLPKSIDFGMKSFNVHLFAVKTDNTFRCLSSD